MFWGTLAMEQVMNILKNERISGATLILLIVGMFWVRAWADDRFAKVEDLVTLQQTVELGFETIAINDASAEIRDIKLSLQMAQATESTEGNLKRIDEELAHAVDYKKCLIRREPNCEHLREVE